MSLTQIINTVYKGFNENLQTYDNFQYVEGQTYTEDNPQICLKGLHACLDPLDCLYYYHNTNSLYYECQGTYDIEDCNLNEPTKVSCKSLTLTSPKSINELAIISYNLYPEKWKFRYRVIQQNNGYNIIDFEGNLILSESVDNIKLIDNNLCLLFKQNEPTYLFNLSTKTMDTNHPDICITTEPFYLNYYKLKTKQGWTLIDINNFEILFDQTYFYFINTPNDDNMGTIALSNSNKYFILNIKQPYDLTYYNYPFINVNNNKRYVTVTNFDEKTYNIFDLKEFKFTYNTWMDNISPVYDDNVSILTNESGFNVLSADGSGLIYDSEFSTIYDMQSADFHEGYYSTTPFYKYEFL